MKIIISPYNCFKKSIIGHKGFSLLEIMVSAATMAFLAVMFQSILVVANSFNTSQKNFIDVYRVNKFVQNSLCFSSETFKPHIGFDPTKMFRTRTHSSTHNSTGSTGTPVKSTTYKDRKYNQSSFANSTSSGVRTPQLGLEINGAQNVSGHLNQGSADETQIKNAVDPANTDICFDGASTPNRFYPVLQDSHTLIKLNLDTSSGATKLVSSGFVVASRCVKNDKLSLYKESNNYLATYDMRSAQQEATAAYILSLPYRPFYYPNEDPKSGYHNIVKCCEVGGGNTSNCQNVVSDNANDDTYVPRIYYIHFDSKDLQIDTNKNPDGECLDYRGNQFTAQKKPRFFGTITSIDELPELQEAQLNWGAGFILTTNGSGHEMNSVQYSLDTLFIKNKCATNPGLASQCPNLEFGTNPGTLTIEGLAGSSLKGKDLLEFEVSGCFSSGGGVKHGKPIRF